MPVQRVPRWSLLRFAAAAALLLVTTVPWGYAVGMKQRGLERTWCDEKLQVEVLTLEAAAERALIEVVGAERAFRAEREKTVAERRATAKSLAAEGGKLERAKGMPCSTRRSRPSRSGRGRTRR